MPSAACGSARRSARRPPARRCAGVERRVDDRTARGRRPQSLTDRPARPDARRAALPRRGVSARPAVSTPSSSAATPPARCQEASPSAPSSTSRAGRFGPEVRTASPRRRRPAVPLLHRTGRAEALPVARRRSDRVGRRRDRPAALVLLARQAVDRAVLRDRVQLAARVLAERRQLRHPDRLAPDLCRPPADRSEAPDVPLQ